MKAISRLRWLAVATTLSVAAAVILPGTAHADSPSGWHLLNAGSRKCLDVRSEDGSLTPGARVQQYRCKPNDGNQEWNMVELSDGTYHLVNAASGLCLDVIGGGTDDSTPTQQWYCHDGANQRWKRWFVPGGGYVWTVQSSGKCLDVAHGSGDDHATVQQYECNGTSAQQWQLTIVFG